MEFRTRPDGTRYPITPKKGGVVVAAAATAVLVGAAGAGFGGAGSSGSQAGSAGKASSKDSARKGRHEEAWRKLGLRATRKTAKRAEVQCVAHAYGQVREFLTENPCRSLERVLFAVDGGDGGTIAISVAWVRMRSASPARELRQLADTDGTGNISPLAGALLDAGDISFSGEYYGSRRDGALVVISEAAAIRGRPDPGVMDDAAEVAAEFPPP